MHYDGQATGRLEHDVAAALEQIRHAIRQRAGYSSQQEVPASPASSPLTEAADLANVSAHLPVTWDTPIVGRAVALSKRVMRLGLRWYINPIVEQQNQFNESVVRSLLSLEARYEQLALQLERRQLPPTEEQQ